METAVSIDKYHCYALGRRYFREGERPFIGRCGGRTAVAGGNPRYGNGFARLTACVSRKWAGRGNAWEQDSAEALKTAKKRAESHLSAARIVRQPLPKTRLDFAERLHRKIDEICTEDFLSSNDQMSIFACLFLAQ
jgi:hypothetical protein